MRRILSLLALLWLLALGSADAQISIPYPNFQPGTTILAEEANANNSALSSQALNRTGGTMTGPLIGTSLTLSGAANAAGLTLSGALSGVTGNFTGALAASGLTSSGHVLPGTPNAYDLGSSSARWATLWAQTGNVSGTLTAGTFSGSGASLTNIPETAIVDGALFARVAAPETITGPWSFNASAPQISLTNATSNWIQWLAVGAAPPTFTSRSLGTRLVLYPNVGASAADFAVGIESATMWLSVPTTGNSFKFYGGTSVAAELLGQGILKLGTNFPSTLNGKIEVASSSGFSPLEMYNSGAAVDEKYTQLVVQGSNFLIRQVNDASNLVFDPFVITRSGYSSATITFNGQTQAASGLGAGAPAYSFVGDPNTGIYRAAADDLGIATNGTLWADWQSDGTLVQRAKIRAVGGNAGVPTYGFSGFDLDSTGMFYDTSLGSVAFSNHGQIVLQLYSGTALITSQAFGVGVGVFGPKLRIGHNSSGAGAAGTLELSRRTGQQDYFWSDAGTLRVGSGPPDEADNTPHSGGTVVGTQTSSLDSKTLLAQRRDYDRMLATLVAAPVYDFRYRSGALTHETFTGIVTDFTPALGMDPDAAHPNGRSLNEINAVGYTIGAVKALDARVRALEAKGR